MDLFKIAKEKFKNNSLMILSKEELENHPELVSSKDMFNSFINYKVDQNTLETDENRYSDLMLFALRTLIEDSYFENNVMGVILKDEEKGIKEDNIIDILFSISIKLIMAHAIKNVVAHKVTDKSNEEYIYFYLITPNTTKRYFAMKKTSFKELLELEAINFPMDEIIKIPNFASFVEYKEIFPKHIVLPLKPEVLKHL